MKEQPFGDFSIFKVGDKVKIISSCVDFAFFRIGTPGIVIENRVRYLGIMVRLPNGDEHGFNPHHLVKVEKNNTKTFVKILTAFLLSKGLLKIEFGLKIIEKIEPKHGNCCACQECGQKKQECICEHNSWVEFIERCK